MSYQYPFKGIKVLDISQGFAGPYCGALLAQYGADVTKVEPLNGDWLRHLGTRYGDHSAHSIIVNQGKRSLAVDLKSPGGGAIAKRLALDCDVFIESSRVGVAKRLGLDYNTIKTNNPGVLYLSVSGFGQTGPYASRPCTDTVAQAMSGLMSINLGADDNPHPIGFILIDTITGLYAFQALSTSLYARQQETEGRHIDISLMQSAAALQAAKIAQYQLENGPGQRLNAPAGSYRCQDGWIAIALVRENDFIRLCQALECDALPSDPKFADFRRRSQNLDTLRPLLQTIFEQKTVAHWLERLTSAKVLGERINDYGRWLADPQVQAVNAVRTIVHPAVGEMPIVRLPGAVVDTANEPDLAQLAPTIGQHTREILTTSGYGEAEIAAFKTQGVIR